MNAPLIRPNTCSTCANRYREGEALSCRANAPVAVLAQVKLPNGQNQLVPQGLFPPVRPEWWCAQFKPMGTSVFQNDAAHVGSRQ